MMIYPFFMGILKKQLKNLLDKEIIVVMNDGRAFKGVLTEFDKDVVVLRHVLEAKAETPVWKESTASTRILGKQEVKGTVIGDTDVVKLDEAILRIALVSRIWKWLPQKPSGY
jgi:small nuclear ribonucleoprotein (snRNP)-like protein